MAARYFINGGSNNLWSTAGNWSATDGGAASGAIPTSSDDVFFTSNSPNCTQDSTGLGKTLTFTGYTNTFTNTNGLTISGNLTLVSAMTFIGVGGTTINAAATLTSNTKSLTGLLIITGGITVTLADNWTVGSFTSSSGVNILNSNQITCNGSFTVGATSLSGTALVVLGGSGGTWGGSGIVYINVTINCTTVTIGNVVLGGGTLTYTAGTVTTTSNTLTIAGNCTLNTSGMSWNNVTCGTASTVVTINSLLTITGTLLTSANPLQFNGTSGFTTATWSCTGGGRVFTLQAAVTYTITTAWTSTAGQTFISSSGSVQAIITLNQGASQTMGAVIATRIDSGGGQTIWDWAGTLTTTTNWKLLVAPSTIGYAYIT
jgi:hypothetical protein